MNQSYGESKSWVPAAGVIGLGVVGFVGGCAIGAMISAPILLTGLWASIQMTATGIIHHVVNQVGLKNHWKLSSIALITTAVNSVVSVAALVTAVALGLLGSTGVIIFSCLLSLPLLAGAFSAYQQRQKELSKEHFL